MQNIEHQTEQSMILFAVYQNAKMPNPNMIYDDLTRSFAEAYCEHYNTFTSSHLNEYREIRRALNMFNTAILSS